MVSFLPIPKRIAIAIPFLISSSYLQAEDAVTLGYSLEF